jgi:hypothetical protein
LMMLVRGGEDGGIITLSLVVPHSSQFFHLLIMFEPQIQPPLRRLRITLAMGRFSMDKDTCGPKAIAKPSQGFRSLQLVLPSTDHARVLR